MCAAMSLKGDYRERFDHAPYVRLEVHCVCAAISLKGDYRERFYHAPYYVRLEVHSVCAAMSMKGDYEERFYHAPYIRLEVHCVDNVDERWLSREILPRTVVCTFGGTLCVCSNVAER